MPFDENHMRRRPCACFQRPRSALIRFIPSHGRRILMRMDLPRIASAVRELLLAVGENPDREGLRDTPQRVARMYEELFGGLHEDPAQHLTTSFTERYDELVVLRDIPFNSICEHHLMPFEGKAHVAYLPDGRVAGISKLARVVEAFARRPQVQERLTTQIANLLMEKLEAKGVAVVIQVTHTCMTCRGVRKPGSLMITSAVRGICRSDPRTRAEVMSLLHS
ncbi:MAG: GTP cyclohydrolase I FolE, partial [Gemmatimonadaceae bacterium]